MAAPLDRRIFATLGRERADHLEDGRVGLPLLHHRAVERIAAAIGVVMQQLLGAVKETRNAAAGEDERGGQVEHLVVGTEALQPGHVVILVEGDELGRALVLAVLDENRLDQIEAGRVIHSKAVANRLAEAEVEDAHSGFVGEFDRGLKHRVGMDPLAEDEEIGFVRLHLGGEFLPEPERDVLDRIDAQRVDALIEPELDGARDILAECDVVFVERGEPAELFIEHLPLVVPIFDAAVVMVPALGVVLVVRDELAVVVELPLPLARAGTAVVADDIQDQLHAAIVQIFDELIENSVGALKRTDLVGMIDPARVDPLEVPRPVAVHGGGIAAQGLDLLKERREPKRRNAEGLQVIELVDNPLQVPAPVLLPILPAGIVELSVFAEIVFHAAVESVKDDKIDGFSAELPMGGSQDG